MEWELFCTKIAQKFRVNKIWLVVNNCKSITYWNVLKIKTPCKSLNYNVLIFWRSGRDVIIIDSIN